MTIIKDLKKLGFTPNEIKIYSVLIDLGQSTAGAIIKKTGLHRNIVYDVLENLVQKKIVLETVQRGKKYFKIRNPQILIDTASEQLNISHHIVKEIKRKAGAIMPEVIVYEGTEGWQTAYRLLSQRLSSKDIICTFGVGGDKWIEAMGDYFVAWEKFLIKNKIANKMVGYAWQKKEILSRQSNPMRKTRYISEKYSIFSNTEIFKDGIFIQVYTDPIILIEVRSKEVAKTYQQHFDTMWKIACE